MKITGATQDYVRMVDSTNIKPVTSVNGSESILDPLHRPIEQTPVEALLKAPKDGEVRQKPIGPDIVELSEEAKGTVLSQGKIEEMLHARLAKTLEAQGVDLSEHQGLDYSPDAVSQRIVDYSISLYGVFREQNTSLSENEAMNKFESTIRGAVDNGFDDAMDILEGVGLSDDVLNMGRDTKAQIDSRFDDFFSRSRS
ncbi:MAG: hypothetical protein GY811_11555 [Myxococcales bacterium]|nr:hypothetical protein [Myxococcales bacterium]